MKKFLPLLSIGFSGFLVYLFDKIWGSSIDWGKVRTFKLGEWFSGDFSIKKYELILFAILAIASYFIGRKVLNKDRFFSAKQKKLRMFNHLTTNDDILFKWSVWFHDDDTPFIADLTAFCAKHPGPPLRFMGNRCAIHSCINYGQAISLTMAKNHIESILIDKWDKMN